MDIQELIRKAKFLKPLVQIGKKGITESNIKEIIKLLKNKKLVKLKILKNCPISSKDEIIKSVITRTDSAVILKVGNVFVIYKE